MSSREVGRRIGRSESYVSLLRRGKREPSVAVIKKLRGEFDLDPGEFFGALEAGPEAFGQYLERAAFTVPDPEPEPEPEPRRDPWREVFGTTS
jgi:transcriptional regulator with XRE-family HTH domain